MAELINLGPYLLWVAVAAILAFTLEFAKRKVFTRHRAERNRFINVARATLPIHPMLGGALVGMLTSAPVPDWLDGSRMGAAIYFAAAGVFSSHVYGAIKQWIKWRGRYLPGCSDVPTY